MPAAAVIGGVASIYAADKASSAQNKATDAATAAQQQNLDFQKQQYANWQGTYHPVEQALASRALQAGSDGEIKNNMGLAYADATQNQQNQMGQMQRQMTRAGINPNSGRFAGMMNENAIAGAANAAGMENSARNQTKMNAVSEQAQVAGLGRNIPAQAGQNMNQASMGLLYSGQQYGNMAATQGKAIGGLANGINKYGQDQGWWGSGKNSQSNSLYSDMNFQPSTNMGETTSVPDNYSYDSFAG